MKATQLQTQYLQSQQIGAKTGISTDRPELPPDFA
jgi:hypothetical protein